MLKSVPPIREKRRWDAWSQQLDREFLDPRNRIQRQTSYLRRICRGAWRIYEINTETRILSDKQYFTSKQFKISLSFYLHLIICLFTYVSLSLSFPFLCYPLRVYLCL